jgi:hypothetical protein
MVDPNIVVQHGLSLTVFLCLALLLSSIITPRLQAEVNPGTALDTCSKKQINDIDDRLFSSLKGKQTIAIADLLTRLTARIQEIGLNSSYILGAVKSKINDEGKSGATSQAMILLTNHWLKGNITSDNEIVVETAKQIENIQNRADPKQISGAIIWIAEQVESGIPAPQETVNVGGGAIDQIYLQIANKGGNMTKAAGTLMSSLSTEMIQAVSNDALPLLHSLDLLYHQESAGNVSRVNEILDNITNQVVGKESNIDKIIIQQVLCTSLRDNSPASHTACHRS